MFARAIKKLFRSEKGMTGLETAIILIAFVTVASVLAYSVLSAGLFSSEKGKQTIYQGIQQAQSTMEISGSVIGLSPNLSKLEQVEFNLSLAVPDSTVDTTAIVVNYFDDAVHQTGATRTITLSAGSTERGTANVMEGDEQFTVIVTVPASANTIAYKTFTIQIIPPTGATLTITRTMPPSLSKVMDLR